MTNEKLKKGNLVKVLDARFLPATWRNKNGIILNQVGVFLSVLLLFDYQIVSLCTYEVKKLCPK